MAGTTSWQPSPSSPASGQSTDNKQDTTSRRPVTDQQLNIMRQQGCKVKKMALFKEKHNI